MRRRAHDIGAWLRRRTETAKDEAKAITGEMAIIAAASLADARRVALNARRSVNAKGTQMSGKAIATLTELEVLIERLEQVVTQTRGRLAGSMPEGSTRLVSLHDADARPIKKGRMGKPVEFGYLGQVVDNAEGIVLDHSLHRGNPPDGPLLAPAIARIKALVGRAPRQVTADRGYGEARIDAELEELGVRMVAIVRKGRSSTTRRAIERTPRFRRLIKWRTGSEGRISALKRNYGWNRSLMDGLVGTTTWCGYGVFVHNAVKISGLIAQDNEEKDADPSQVTRRESTRPPPRSRSSPSSAPA